MKKNNVSMILADNLEYVYILQSVDETGQSHNKEEILAVNDVTLSIKKGEFVAVLGHNGSGKSTFAKLINALIAPSRGRILVNGFDTSKEENIWPVRQSAGMVFQNPDNQIIATVVEEDVAFGPENLGIKPDEIRKRVYAALDTVGMREYTNHSPHFLSGGQKQRVAIAGVLAMKPECIVLDEPTAMLDPIGRLEVIDAVLKLNKEEGMTVILITHYMEEAVKADRIVVMDSGKVVLDSTPKEVFKKEKLLREIGLDVPQVTEIGLRLGELGLDIPDGILTIDEMVEAICRLK